MEKETRKRIGAGTDWEEILQDCSESGLSKTEWCRLYGIVPKTFFYHQRKARDLLRPCRSRLRVYGSAVRDRRSCLRTEVRA